LREFLNELKRRNVLRVAVGYLAAAWLVVQVVETVLPVFGLPDVYIRWVVIGLAILFLPVLALSWSFEWSESGLERQSEIDSDNARRGPASRTFDRIVIAVLAFAVLFFAADKFLFPSMRGGLAGPTSIAVLPFADLTPTQDRAYFADGFAEELLDALSRNRALRVAARTSSFSFRGQDLPIGEIAARLGVAYILEGSVRSAGERAELSVRLVSAAEGFNVWSAAFDREMNEIHAIKTDVVEQIEQALSVEDSAGADSGRVPDPRAFVLFLQGNYLARDNSPASRESAVETYRRALEIDPDFAEAWANLSATYFNQAVGGQVEWNRAYRLARDAALRAVAADERSSPGYKQLSDVARMFEGDLEAAFANMQRAIDLDPTNPHIISGAAVALLTAGKLDRSIILQEFLVDRSPMDAIAAFNLGLAYRYADRLEESLASFERVRDLSPGWDSIDYQVGETLLLMGRAEDALEHFTAEPDEAYRLKGLALAYAALGDEEASDRALDGLVEGYGERWPSEVAHVYAWRGERDEAFAWLEKELEAYGPGGWGEWQLQRLYDKLRDDPRWEALLRRTGTAPAQLADLTLDLPEDVYL